MPIPMKRNITPAISCIPSTIEPENKFTVRPGCVIKIAYSEARMNPNIEEPTASSIPLSAAPNPHMALNIKTVTIGITGAISAAAGTFLSFFPFIAAASGSAQADLACSFLTFTIINKAVTRADITKAGMKKEETTSPPNIPMNAP